MAYLPKFVSESEKSKKLWPEMLQMHYWRALKASKFNVVHCDPSTGAAWLSAPLCVFHKKQGPL